MRLVVVDTETGGLDPSRHPILTLGAVAWQDGEIGESVEWKFYAPPQFCDPQALRVNGIDIEQHNQEAIRPDEAAQALLRFGRRYSDGTRIRLAGHNIVGFDAGFLRALYGPSDFWRYFHHRSIDTMTMLPFLWLAGQGRDIGKLSDACDAFGIELTDAHTALGDALATARLLTVLVERMRG